jgi:hypothetical protein
MTVNRNANIFTHTNTDAQGNDGNIDWDDPSLWVGSSGSGFAACSFGTGSSQLSEWGIGGPDHDGGNAKLPDSATINGFMRLHWTRKAAAHSGDTIQVETYIRDETGTRVGTSKTFNVTTEAPTTPFGQNNLGGSVDLWGLSPGVITAADVNTTNYGAEFQFSRSAAGAAGDVEMDAFRHRTYYSTEAYAYDSSNSSANATTVTLAFTEGDDTITDATTNGVPTIKINGTATTQPVSFTSISLKTVTWTLHVDDQPIEAGDTITATGVTDLVNDGAPNGSTAFTDQNVPNSLTTSDIDTAQKRMSMMNMFAAGAGYHLLSEPDASVDGDDKQALLDCYGGIAFDTGAAGAPLYQGHNFRMGTL